MPLRVIDLFKRMFRRAATRKPTGPMLRVETLEDRAMLSNVTVQALAPASENGPTGLIRFARDGDTSQALTAFVAIGGTAAPGQDFQFISSQIQFAAGVNEVFVPVVSIDDAVAEPTETVSVTVMPGAGYQPGSPAMAVVDILDNDTTPPPPPTEPPIPPPPTQLPLVAIEKVANAAEIGTVGVIRFTRTGDLSQPLTASYRIDGTASSGSDYATLNQTVTFLAGAHSVLVTISANADNLKEGAETVRFSLDPNPAYLASGIAELVVIDNPPAVWVDEYSAVETETLPGEVILRRSGGNLNEALTVILAVGPDDVPPDPTTGGSTSSGVVSHRTVSVTFAPGETIVRQVVVTGPNAVAELAAGVAVALVDNSQYLVGSSAAVPVSATAPQPGQPAPPVEYYDVHFALVLARSETRKTLKQQFAPTVEDFPVTFQIHHTRMEALKTKYAALGINVDALENLRAVHPSVHEEISDAQDK